MDFSGGSTLRATMLFAVLAFTTVKFAHGAEISCTDDRDCSYEQYCYNVSSECVDFIPCSRYYRVEGPKPARHSSQCGSCYPGYTAELLGTGVREETCKEMLNSKGTQTESESEFQWPWHWIAMTILAIVALVLLLAILLRKFICTTNRDKFCKKMIPWSTRPTAPPQDEATYRLRSKTYHVDEERPPIYSSVIGPSIDKDNLVNAAPYVPPDWVMKPNYDHDYNDNNVASGVAMPNRTSSTNLQMDLDEEEETNPSSWTPGQLTVDVPSRPFARFAIEQQDNVMNNNMLLRGNCSSNSNHEEQSNSEEAAGLPEEPSTGSRSHSDIFCGPNVQINQTITLNIGKNGTK